MRKLILLVCLSVCYSAWSKISDDLHERCKTAVDYLGCVDANKDSALNSESIGDNDNLFHDGTKSLREIPEYLTYTKTSNEDLCGELMYNHTIYDTANMGLDDPFDYRGYAQWRLHRGELAPAHKGSITIEF